MTARGLWSEFFLDLEVANRGIGSDTSEGLLGRLDTIVGCDPEAVVVMIGVNDLGQGVEEDEICGNVSELLDRLADQSPSSHVVLMGVLPAGNVDDERVVSLNARYRDLAESRPGVAFLDLHDKYLDGDGERDASLYDDDGVHLNGHGYRIWIEAISALL